MHFLAEEQYEAAIAARRKLTVGMCAAALARDMKTFRDVGWDGEYVVPNQITSRSLSGPVLLLDNWIGWPTAAAWSEGKRNLIAALGYDPNLQTNCRIDSALCRLSARLNKTVDRGDLYITQASVFLSVGDRGAHPVDCYRLTYDLVTRLELAGRKVIAAGAQGRKIMEAIQYPSERLRMCRHPAYESINTLASLIEWGLHS